MHRFANPTRFLALARPLTGWSIALGLILLAAGSYAGLALSPPDYLQGETARILYVHVPSAWLGMAGWAGLAMAGAAQLVWRHPLAWVAARAIALPGAVFTALCLVTGSIWGRPTWGTWWEWDGRMTSMLVLLFLYIGHIAITRGEDRREPGKISAIYAIVGVAILPVIKGSVVYLNTLHQPASITLSGSAIANELLWPLALTLPGFTLVFLGVVLMRMRATLAETRIEARVARLAGAGA